MDKSEISFKIAQQVIEKIKKNDSYTYFRFKLPLNEIDGIKCQTNISILYTGVEKDIEIKIFIFSKHIKKTCGNNVKKCYFRYEFNSFSITKSNVVEIFKDILNEIILILSNLSFSSYSGKFFESEIVKLEYDVNDFFFDSSKKDDTNVCFICNEFVRNKFRLRCCKKAMCLKCREKNIAVKGSDAKCPFGCDKQIRYLQEYVYHNNEDD